ncbi:flagellar hook assembly protein FlgD [Pectinatus sottacetonis]|uniref:flagellar hook assembly protein FlgD n=1 Tax=Pectinatus sottacetonis TaxID=1002795 RepID=UPI0018C79532|nr:flagellar hook capping FlgD N-terminal domain-containing protein [Pectinatus sottacetonis]
MSINPVSSGTSNTVSSAVSSASLANEDTFMQLLVAQMKNQDPLNPLDGTQYISQLSQLTATEQTSKMATAMDTMSSIVDNLNTSVLVGQLSSMIGKKVTWMTTKTLTDSNGETSTQKVQNSGTAQGVTISDGVPSLVVKNGSVVTTVKVSDLTLIGNTGLEKE